MDAIGFFEYFGIPTFFLLLCMSVVGWVGRKQKREFVHRRFRWITTWAVIGFFVALLLAVTAWIMNTNFVYNNASLVWPFCLTLGALDGHPPIGVGLLVVSVMGLVNGLYYALLAALSWVIMKAISTKSRAE